MKRLATELGYKIEGRVLNAADYGAPQTRKRAIVIGSRIAPPTNLPFLPDADTLAE